MKKFFLIIGILSMIASVSAIPIDITIDDGLTKGNFGFGYVPGSEDQSVNFGSDWGQQWDLEAFFYDDATNTLSMQSGFNAFSVHPQYVLLGDIFIDVNSDDSWDYVIDFNQNSTIHKLNDYTYSIVDLTVDDPVFADLQWPYREDGLYDHSDALPYALQSGGSVLEGGIFEYDQLGSHFTMSEIDLSFLAGQDFTVHQTMSCGNDVMEGRFQSVPEPTIITMLGLGLISIAFFRRKK